jgi:hypothetical protein
MASREDSPKFMKEVVQKKFLDDVIGHANGIIYHFFVIQFKD